MDIMTNVEMQIMMDDLRAGIPAKGSFGEADITISPTGKVLIEHRDVLISFKIHNVNAIVSYCPTGEIALVMVNILHRVFKA